MLVSSLASGNLCAMVIRERRAMSRLNTYPEGAICGKCKRKGEDLVCNSCSGLTKICGTTEYICEGCSRTPRTNFDCQECYELQIEEEEGDDFEMKDAGSAVRLTFPKERPKRQRQRHAAEEDYESWYKKHGQYDVQDISQRKPMVAEDVLADEEIVGMASAGRKSKQSRTNGGGGASKILVGNKAPDDNHIKPTPEKRGNAWSGSFAAIGLVAIISLVAGVSYFRKKVENEQGAHYLNVSERRTSNYSRRFSAAADCSYEAPFLISV